MRKVFLENLPKWENGISKGKINWKETVGHKVKFIYDDIEGLLKIIDYNNSNRKIDIEYNDKRATMYSSDFIKCQLGRLLGTYTGNFKIEIGKIFKDSTRDLIIIDREYRKNNKEKYLKWYKYKCNKCGNEYWIIEYFLLDKGGCNACCNFGGKPTLGINTIYDTDKWMIPYLSNKEDAKKFRHNTNKKITVKCPYCNREKSICVSTLYKKHSISCICGDGYSYPNKFMFNVLEQLGVDFIPEYSPEWIKPKAYDFYVPSLNLIIEMDGGLGHGKIIHGKSKITKDESIEIDNYKDEMARKNGIKVVRIDCMKSEMEHIKQSLLNSRLFNLSIINWSEVEKFALSNLVKQACDYKKDNLNLTCKEIAKMMKSSPSTIRIYLKKGHKLGWCHYDAKEESIKNIGKGGKLKGIPVEVFKDEKSLGVFESAKELCRQSEDIFNIKFDHSSICSVCRGELKHHKRYVFKYKIKETV